jgi:hypothetical protein
MKNEFISYNQALSLKDLGFDEPCLAKHDLKYILLRIEECKSQENAQEFDYILAPLYQQAFKWFREKYNLCGVITPQSYEIWGYPDGGCIIEQYPVHTYEEAEQACLDKLIEIVKNGK